MILTKEHQEHLVTKYLQGHTVAELEAFIEGMNAVIELINKNVEHDVTKPNT